MAKYVILDNKQLKVVELAEMLPNANVVAEVINEDDMLVVLRNPFASVYDFMWPENMFLGDAISLDEFRKRYEIF